MGREGDGGSDVAEREGTKGAIGSVLEGMDRLEGR